MRQVANQSKAVSILIVKGSIQTAQNRVVHYESVVSNGSIVRVREATEIILPFFQEE